MAQMLRHTILELHARRQARTLDIQGFIAWCSYEAAELCSKKQATASWVAIPATHPTSLPGLLSGVMALLRADQAGSARICWESKALHRGS